MIFVGWAEDPVLAIASKKSNLLPARILKAPQSCFMKDLILRLTGVFV